MTPEEITSWLLEKGYVSRSKKGKPELQFTFEKVVEIVGEILAAGKVTKASSKSS